MVQNVAGDFHAWLKAVCDSFDPDWYGKYKKWADDYFWLPHRGKARGVGGIFYDHHDSGDWDRSFRLHPKCRRRLSRYLSPDRQTPLGQRLDGSPPPRPAKWRGRYVEFNLLYDRGTTFGLKTGGNVESILSSMPPVKEWT